VTPDPSDPATPDPPAPEQPEPAAHAPDASQPRGPMWSGASGAAAERTRLAWRRTTLASTVILVLSVRLGVNRPFSVLGVTVVALVFVVWLAQMWLTQRRIGGLVDQQPATIVRTLVGMSTVAGAFAVLALILTVT
jgi:hypothetical protein